MGFRRIAVMLLFCVAFPAWAWAQVEGLTPVGVEYGDLTELLGKRRVFVHAENLGARDKIVKELTKSKWPVFEVVGRMEDADFLLVFGPGLVQTGQTAFDNFAPGGGGDAVVLSGSMVAFRLAGVEGEGGGRTRVLWHTDKRQTFIRTDQFFRAPYYSSPRSNLIGSAVGGFLSLIPKLSVIPFGRSPEVKATGDFIKALSKVYERQADYAKSPSLALAERPHAVNPAFAEERREVVHGTTRAGNAPSREDVQHPRVFYRREPEAQPFVITGTTAPPRATLSRGAEAEIGPPAAAKAATEKPGTTQHVAAMSGADTSAADRNPHDFTAQIRAADALRQINDYAREEHYLRRALAFKPGDPRARTSLGNTYLRRPTPDYDRALAEYRLALTSDPRYEEAWQNLAAAALLKRSELIARDAIKQLEALNPSHPSLPRLRSGLGQLHPPPSPARVRP